MAALRLNVHDRTRLIILAKQLVKCSDQQAQLDVAYQACADMVLDVVERRYPPKDMDILLKYQAAEREDEIRLQPASGSVGQFVFNEGTGPLTPGTCRIYGPLSDQQTDIYDTWRIARDALKKAMEIKLRDYDTLINASRTWEEIENIWPEASQERPQGYRVPSALGADALARIRADVASRQAA